MFSNGVVVQENHFYTTKNNILASITIRKTTIINIVSAVINVAPAIAKISIADIDIISALRN